MPQFDSEADTRVYGEFTRALLSASPVGPLAPVKGAEAEIAAGLAVYRNNVRSAYLRVLSDAFPVVARLVGDGFLRYAAREYFHAYPPRTPIVARYGDDFPAFLAGFEPASAHPYLADVARIEIAWLEAYHASEAAPAPADEILNCIGAAAESARFVFHPSMKLLSSVHPAFSIWRHNYEKRDGALRPPPRGERVLIVRPETEVVATEIDNDTYITLQSLAAGARLGEAIDSTLDERPNASMSEILKAIVSARVIVSTIAN